jgi:hypothetical protein
MRRNRPNVHDADSKEMLLLEVFSQPLRRTSVYYVLALQSRRSRDIIDLNKKLAIAVSKKALTPRIVNLLAWMQSSEGKNSQTATLDEYQTLEDLDHSPMMRTFIVSKTDTL